ncbi:intraflagellar transport protein 52 homolog [Takifugu flavidus]|uniref:Intraflagellar transport protein 52-like protein n=1 Tax=Takifugu flavidus TaxID=433684 RepID=A0A5C6N6L0_9TELE|nr:intraflagellar transport protein 52 homolog [Takifugu flavidus]TWW61881.1 Intraflagellar transport protein 52 -like protein [Takifugu flavidus]
MAAVRPLQCDAVAFNASKRELFTISSRYKSMQRRLGVQWSVQSMSGTLSLERLERVRLWITVGPREQFTASELEVLKEYLDGGGHVMVLLGEGGETKYKTNINFLLEELGIVVNKDAVVRNVYHRYLHPKEALVSDGVLNREISRAADKEVKGTFEEPPGNDPKALAFLYPYGATLNVMKPAVAVLSTGSLCFPFNRPVMAFREGKGTGKLVVLGSCHMFSDEYIDKEENSKILDAVLQWIMTDDAGMNGTDAAVPAISEYTMIPDTQVLSEKLQLCFQHNEDHSRNFTSLFDMSLFNFSSASLPRIVSAYKELNVKYEPLHQAIRPNFEAPLPPLQPAVFPPIIRDLSPPVLEQFDLDEAFPSDREDASNSTDDNFEFQKQTPTFHDQRDAQSILSSRICNGVCSMKAR